MSKLWFKSKSWGYGWTPCSKEGWLVTIGFVLATIYTSIKYSKTNQILFFGYLISLVAVLIFIAHVKGEKPHWNWGKKRDI